MKIEKLVMPNGETVMAALMYHHETSEDGGMTLDCADTYYSQNRLFVRVYSSEMIPLEDGYDEKLLGKPEIKILSEYCTIPDVDTLLEEEFKKEIWERTVLDRIVKVHDLDKKHADYVRIAELVLRDVEESIFNRVLRTDTDLATHEAAIFFILTEEWGRIYSLLSESTRDFIVNDAALQTAYEHAFGTACRIPAEKPEDAEAAKSFKESEVEKASDSDIDLVEIPDWSLLGFSSKEEYEEYMDEGQRLADDIDRCWADEAEDMDRIKKKFMLGRRYSLYAGGTYQILHSLIEGVVTVLNKKSKKTMYWDDAVKCILGEPTWACACDLVKKDFPSLYQDLTGREGK